MEIVSLCLALEPDGFDKVIQDFAENAGFHYSGLDALPDAQGAREQSRAGYDYFTGRAVEPVRNTRRRLVVLNGLTDSPTHDLWEPIVNQDYFLTNNDAEDVRLAIDAVEPAASSMTPESPDGLTFDVWAESLGVGDPDADPDADGLTNRVEFFSGLDPTYPNRSLRERLHLLRQSDGVWILRYPRTARARKVSARLLTSDNLTDWRPHGGMNVLFCPLMKNVRMLWWRSVSLPLPTFAWRSNWNEFV